MSFLFFFSVSSVPSVVVFPFLELFTTEWFETILKPHSRIVVGNNAIGRCEVPLGELLLAV